MENHKLAIPYIPMQQWNQTYPLDQALAEGTIFPELNMCFFAAPQGCNTTLRNNEGKDAYQQFTQVCFALDDTLLYLDTHPEDAQAIQFYEECLQKKAELMEETECGCGCANHYLWKKKPLVWEGGHCVCGVTNNDCNIQ